MALQTPFFWYVFESNLLGWFQDGAAILNLHVRNQWPYRPLSFGTCLKTPRLGVPHLLVYTCAEDKAYYHQMRLLSHLSTVVRYVGTGVPGSCMVKSTEQTEGGGGIPERRRKDRHNVLNTVSYT